MTPELWERLKPLFEGALATAPEERSWFIEKACGDDGELRRELASLLDEHVKPEATLEKIAMNLQRLTGANRSKFQPSEIILGRFKILRELGSGGMGDVYEALDLDLGQTIALKAIRPEIAEDEQAISRFKKEVQLARKFAGPNICRIHEFFTVSEGNAKPARAFLTMEFLEGITLAEKLESGPVSWEELRPIAMDLCAALTTIHDAGIIHRDLKCRNIMLVEKQGSRRAVLMDFGLAREFAPGRTSPNDALTMPGAIIGTPEYMAPEQFESKTVSPATDIYAMGVVLYESLTGKRPFEVPSAVSAAAIRGSKPEPASLIRRGVPERISRVINRCLEADPNNRYQSARELAVALKGPAWRTGRRAAAAMVGAVALAGLLLAFFSHMWLQKSRGAGTTYKSVAVLPLQNLTGDPGQDYFVDGMTDALTANLAQIATLRVPARSSTMEFKDAKLPASEIAKKLNVEVLLEGSVMRSGPRVKISAQLIEAKGDRHIWAKSYESESRDVIALQDELARDVAGEVRASLAANNQKRLTDSRSVDPGAYEAYLRGRYLWNRRTEPELQRAKQYFEDSISKDPGFAPAYAGLADTYFYLSYAWGHIPPRDGIPLAKAAALKAIELDDGDADGHNSLGLVNFFFDWDIPGAEQEFERAIALNPNNASALDSYSTLLAVEGRIDEAIVEARKAAAVDPLSVPAANTLSSLLAAGNRCDESIAVTQKAFELDPNPTHVTMLRGSLEYCFNLQGKTREAFDEELKVREAQGASPAQIEDLRRVFARSGFKGIWEKQLQDQLKEWDKDHWHLEAFGVAWTYARIGKYDQAFAWLDKCIDLRSTALMWIYVRPSPFYDHPKLAEVRRKMGLRF